MTKLSCATALAATLIAAPAFGQNLVASDPEGIRNYLMEEGIPAKLTVDNVGDPLIEVRYFGTEFSIYFYGCTQNTDCTSIQYFSGYASDGAVSLEAINSWNENQRFARGYVTEEGAARIEYDIFLGETGLTTADFDTALSVWTRNLSEFEDFIGW
ncbi:MAG: YbjN domain-containing protein [Paracoccaceae bacterium]|nr:YbjN domain-containing protein [Paracoccaceae bacterium]